MLQPQRRSPGPRARPPRPSAARLTSSAAPAATGSCARTLKTAAPPGCACRRHCSHRRSVGPAMRRLLVRLDTLGPPGSHPQGTCGRTDKYCGITCLSGPCWPRSRWNVQPPKHIAPRRAPSPKPKPAAPTPTPAAPTPRPSSSPPPVPAASPAPRTPLGQSPSPSLVKPLPTVTPTSTYTVTVGGQGEWGGASSPWGQQAAASAGLACRRCSGAAALPAITGQPSVPPCLCRGRALFTGG